MLEDNGLIEERVDKLVYSIDDGRFLPDRYIEGTCPHLRLPPRRAATSATTAAGCSIRST